MIPSTTRHCQADDWKSLLASSIRDPQVLLDALDLDPARLPEPLDPSPAFPLRVPLPFLARMRRGDARDPLLRQVLGLRREREPSLDFVHDPVGDAAAAARPGLLHKYRGRALIITTGACPVHCRYCFRRHFPYAEARAADGQWRETLAHLADDPSIHEVILSGGDPLSLDTERLHRLTDGLRRIPHLRRLRLHTRMPVVLPQRVDDALLDWLSGLPWPVAMVIHANHVNEFDTSLREALGRCRQAGVSLLNQSVLLQGVNDSEDDLAALSEALFDAGVMPYYLHLLDRVQGAAHFEVAEPHARRLVDGLRRRLPGYLVPRLVRETAGAPYKQLADVPLHPAPATDP